MPIARSGAINSIDNSTTLALILGGANILLATLLQLFQGSTGSTRPRQTWALAKLLEGLGFVLVGLRGQLPDIATIPLATSFLLGGFGAEFAAAWSYLGLGMVRRAFLAVSAALIVSFWIAYLIGEDSTGRIVQYNLSAAIIFGVTAGGYLRNWKRLSPVGRVVALSYPAIATFMAARGTYVLFGDDAAAVAGIALRPVALAAQYLFLLFNGVSFLLLARQDIDRRLRERDAQLRLNRRHLNLAQRLGRVGSAEINIATGATVWSDEYFRIIGRDRATTAPSAEQIIAAVHPGDRELVQGVLARMHSGVETASVDFRVLRPNGELAWVRRHQEFERDAEGRPAIAIVTLHDITAQVLMENELRRGQASLVRAQKIGRIGSVEIDLAAQKATWSEELYNIYGRDPALGPADLEALLAYIHPDDRGQVDAIRAQQLQGVVTGANEFRIIRGDGEVRWIHREVELVRDPSGKPITLFTIEQDITERVRIEEELRRKEEHLVRAQRVGVTGSVEVDLVGGQQSWSDGLYAIFGLDPAAVTPSFENALRFVHPDDHAALMESHRRAMAGEAAYPVEARILRPDGEERWIVRQSEVVRTPAGEAIRLIVTYQDITDRKRLEAELRHGRDRLEFAQRMARMGSAEFNLRTGAAVRSDEFFRVVGQDPNSQPAGLDGVVNAFHPDDRPKIRDAMVRMMAGEEVPTLELRTSGESGEIRWVRRDQQNVIGVDGKSERVVVTLLDITDQKRLEQQKDEFVSTVSHELRTPLTSIRGALQLIASNAAGELPEKARHLVDLANRNSERLASLVDDLLDLQRIQEGRMIYHMAEMDLFPVIGDAIETIRPFAARHGVEVKLQVACANAHIQGDAQRVGQVMANLLSNAIKFSKSGQVVEVRVERRSPWLRITVEDHGEGIPDEFRARIFKRFSQSDATDTRKRGGSGLGLTIVQAIVERHEGTISYESKLGIGTSFHVDFRDIAAGTVNPAAASRARSDEAKIAPST